MDDATYHRSVYIGMDADYGAINHGDHGSKPDRTRALRLG